MARASWRSICSTTNCCPRAEAMADLFGVRLVAATLARMSRSCAERFSGFAEAVCERVKAAPVKHLDGPSGNIEKEEWAHKMQRLLRRACNATQLARGVPIEARLIDQFRRRYDIIVTEGLAFHQDQPPLATLPTNGKRRGPRRTIFSCASAPAKTTCCAFWTIPLCPSPTIRPSATGA